MEIRISCNHQRQEYFAGSCASAVRNFSENESITSWRFCGVRVSRKLTKRHGSNAALKNPGVSTTDQFFSESQFESYRMLAAYTMEKLWADCAGDFRDFVREILKTHLEMEAPDWLAKLLDESGNNNAAERISKRPPSGG